jgi:hypothetical protein
MLAESSGPGPVAGSPHAVLGALSRRRRSSRLRRGVGMPLPAPPAGKNGSTQASDGLAAWLLLQRR